MVYHQVGEPLAVAAESQQQRQHRHSEQRPLHGAAHHDAAQQEQRAHDGANVHGAVRAFGVIEILSHVGQELRHRLAGIGRSSGQAVQPHVNHRAALGTRRRAALDVGNQQREALGAAIAPAYNLLVRHTARGTRSVRVGGCRCCGVRRQFALAALRLFAVFIGIVQARGIGAHSQQSGTGQHRRSREPAAHTAGAPCLPQIGQRHRRHHEEEVVAHLRMVGGQLEHGEDARHGRAREIASAIAQHQAADCGRDIGQGHEFPYVAGTYDNDKIA